MRIDSYMKVNQLYNTSQAKINAKAGKISATDFLEISEVGSAYHVAKQAFTHPTKGYSSVGRRNKTHSLSSGSSAS